MRLSRQFQACLFFFTKRFRAHKNTSPLEVYACVKNCCLCCLVLAYFCFVSWFLLVTCFCARKIFSSKKINKVEIVLIASLYYPTIFNIAFGRMIYLSLNLLSNVIHKCCYPRRQLEEDIFSFWKCVLN